MTPHVRPDVRIVHLTGPVFRALAGGDLVAANAVSPVPVSAYVVGPDCRGVWQLRSRQVEEDPACAAWVSQYGFAPVGEQWDDEDGLEIVYEVTAGRL